MDPCYRDGEVVLRTQRALTSRRPLLALLFLLWLLLWLFGRREHLHAAAWAAAAAAVHAGERLTAATKMNAFLLYNSSH
jgi:hypothetical protein